MKSEKGQSLVEFALTIPILLILLFGIVDFGRLFHVYLTIDHAGREAARLAAIGAEDSAIRAKVNSSTPGIEESKLDIAISPSDKNNRTSGANVEITIKYTDFEFITPFIGSLFSPLTVTDKTTMRVE